MRFIAIDVETANADMASICQIGGVVFEHGVEVDHFVTLIDPEDYFDEYNVAIHGISEDAVVGAPIFEDFHDKLCAKMDGAVVVCHTHFDRVSLRQACEQNDLPELACTWLDSAKMARRAWEQVASSGYGLANVAAMLGIRFQHHDALEDARAAGLVLLEAMKATELDLDGCIVRCSQPLRGPGTDRLSLDGCEGPLADHRIVFTGSLCVSRVEAATLANSFGAAIDTGVTKKTTMLVVGDQDIIRLRGAEKSNKHRKAEALMAAGQRIRIIKESDFAQLCEREHI